MKDFFLKLFGYDVRKPVLGMKLRGKDVTGVGSDIVVEIVSVAKDSNKCLYKFINLTGGRNNILDDPTWFSVYNWHWFINDSYSIIENENEM